MNNQPKTFGPTIQGMLHKLKMIQSIANNIANATTIGYQREIPESLNFKSVLSSVSEKPLKDDTAGQLQKTGNTFDLAIEGNADFLIEDKNGKVSTTKDGRFHLNENGDLVTQNGNKVIVAEKTDKPISLATTYDIHINKNGEIIVGTEKYGRIALKIDDSKPVSVHQGCVIGSNVNLMNEMVSLAMTFRSFEASEKALSMEASADRDLIEKYGRNV